MLGIMLGKDFEGYHSRLHDYGVGFVAQEVYCGNATHRRHHRRSELRKKTHGKLFG